MPTQAEPEASNRKPPGPCSDARAAYLAGDRDLLKVVQEQLRREFALEVRFIKQPATEADCAMKAKAGSRARCTDAGKSAAMPVYPVTVLMRRLGIARNTLASLRRRGLPVHSIGRRCTLIDGGELIRFVRAEWTADQGSKDALDHTGKCGDSAATVPATVPAGGDS